MLQNKKNEKYLFFLIFILFLLFVNYHSLLFLKPRSFHFIRQTDTLSFINYYIKTGFNFFDIGNLNLYNCTGKSACEFPIFYYICALISKTGANSFIVLKLMYISIFFFTSFSLYNFLRKSFSIINSISITFLVFSSTVVLYYMINYIPNYPALCFIILGLINFFYYLENNKFKFFYLACGFFLFAGLLKVTFCIYIIGCFLYLGLLFFKNKKLNYKVLLAFILIFLVLFSWNYYVIYYNKLNNADYYLTSIKPFWQASMFEKQEVFNFITNYWIYKYYYQSTIHVFFIVVILSIFFYKNGDKKQFHLSLIFFCGNICYFILFFKQFRDHDYYFLEFIPFFLLVFMNSYYSIVNAFKSSYKFELLISICLFVLSFLSINYAKFNIKRRYNEPFEQVSRIAYVLENAEEKFDSIGISKNTKILVIPDNTMNGSLYYINKFGYTLGDTLNLNLIKYYNQSEYILITDSSYKFSLEKKFKLNKSVFSYRGTNLYKISR